MDVLLGGAMLKVGWRPECRWLECRVADGRCVRRHLDVVLRIVVVRGGCPVWMRIDAFVT